MVSLVLVSHSHALAVAVKDLALQMADEQVQIEAVGGVVDRQGAFQLGTDATAIAAAIERCWCPAGVLLLVDLGSAVLSAELALELLSAAQAERCLISNAPLVEGAIIATVEASLGHGLATVNAAAEGVVHIPKVIREWGNC